MQTKQDQADDLLLRRGFGTRLIFLTHCITNTAQQTLTYQAVHLVIKAQLLVVYVREPSVTQSILIVYYALLNRAYK